MRLPARRGTFLRAAAQLIVLSTLSPLLLIPPVCLLVYLFPDFDVAIFRPLDVDIAAGTGLFFGLFCGLVAGLAARIVQKFFHTHLVGRRVTIDRGLLIVKGAFKSHSIPLANIERTFTRNHLSSDELCAVWTTHEPAPATPHTQPSLEGVLIRELSASHASYMHVLIQEARERNLHKAETPIQNDMDEEAFLASLATPPPFLASLLAFGFTFAIPAVLLINLRLSSLATNIFLLSSGMVVLLMLFKSHVGRPHRQDHFEPKPMPEEGSTLSLMCVHDPLRRALPSWTIGAKAPGARNTTVLERHTRFELAAYRFNEIEKCAQPGKIP